MSTSKRLTEVLENTEVTIDFDDTDRFILFGDCHRGDNSAADDFAHNQQIFFFALQHYLDEGFTYIELGDGDELWENRDFSEIRKAHDNVYDLMADFYRDGRLYLIWGNHNRDWSKRQNVEKHLFGYTDRDGKPKKLFDKIQVHEGIVLRYQDCDRILLVHGHQGQLWNDDLWWAGRYLVRRAWRPLQILGAKDPTSPADNFEIAEAVEKQLRRWAEENKLVLIAGHTHRSSFDPMTEPAYFNVGSCVHPRCITGIKIQDGQISLVKWWPKPDSEGFLRLREEYVRDETKPVALKEIFARIHGSG
jgi:UDP-2,3-diacylglucosamine pyrophosphatase LpxH